MNKLEQMEAQLKELQKQIEEMKAKEASQNGYVSPWALLELGQGEDGYSIDPYLSGDIDDSHRNFAVDHNAFKEQHVAQGFANAFHVMVALRQCEGAGDVGDDDKGWLMGADEDNMWGYPTEASETYYFALCPPFPSEALLNKAIEAVGKEKLLQAYEFLATGNSNA